MEPTDDREPVKKPRPNHQRTLAILRAMSPQEKLAQVFKLNERTLKLMRIGLRLRFPDLDDEAFEKLYLRMRMRCHNRNYRPKRSPSCERSASNSC